MDITTKQIFDANPCVEGMASYMNYAHSSGFDLANLPSSIIPTTEQLNTVVSLRDIATNIPAIYAYWALHTYPRSTHEALIVTLISEVVVAGGAVNNSTLAPVFTYLAQGTPATYTREQLLEYKTIVKEVARTGAETLACSLLESTLNYLLRCPRHHLDCIVDRLTAWKVSEGATIEHSTSFYRDILVSFLDSEN